MAFTRKFLTALGIEADKVDEIITAHIEVVDGLKGEIAKHEETAKKAEDLEKQLNAANEKLKAADNDGYKEKYNAEHAELEKLKADIAGKETLANKEKAYKNMLKEMGVPEKWYTRVLKSTDLNDIELNEDGSIKGKDTLSESIKGEWGDIIPTVTVTGAQTSNPPANSSADGGKKISRAAQIAAQYHNDRYGETKEGNQ